MKIFLIIVSIFFITGCGEEEQTKTTIKPKIVIADINIANETCSIKYNNQRPEKKELLNPALEDLYHWEYMYLFLHKEFINKSYTQKPFQKFLKKIILQKTDDLTVIKYIIDKDNLKHINPTVMTSGEIDFQSNNVNDAFKLFNTVENKKDMYKYLCISYNSIVYKYSEVIKNEKDKDTKILLDVLYDDNIEKLLLIDSTLKNIKMNGCCEVANILCRVKS